MRGLNRLINRFEWAIKNKKPIHPNREDLESLNEISATLEQLKLNTNLEDSLLLFWVFCNWKIVLNGQKLQFEEEKKGALILPDISVAFDKLCLLLNPKDFVIKEITDVLQVNQKMQGIEKVISQEEVSSFLNESLDRVKEMKYPISQLKKFSKLICDYEKTEV